MRAGSDHLGTAEHEDASAMRVQTNSKETVLVAEVARQRKSQTDQASTNGEARDFVQGKLEWIKRKDGPRRMPSTRVPRARPCSGGPPGRGGPATVYYGKVLSETGQNLSTFLIAWGP